MEFQPAPERPDPPSGEVHVWRTTPTVPSTLALRRVLSRYLSEAAEEIEIARGEHGKPVLAEEAGRLAFNLSHSGELVLVAVSRGREVGVDVERIKPERDLVGLAARALAPAAAAAVREASESERASVFYELWVRHEARLKCLGTGLSGTPSPSPAAVAVTVLPIGPGYAAAVAVADGTVPVRCWTLD